MHLSHRRSWQRYVVAISIGLTLVLPWWLLSPDERPLWTNTLLLLLAVSALVVPTSLIAATLLVRSDAYGRRVSWFLLAGTVLVPFYAHVAGWDAAWGLQGYWTGPNLLGQTAWYSGIRAAITVHAAAAIPWCTVILVWGLATVPRSAEEMLRLDRGAGWVWWHFTVRQLGVSLGAALLWVLTVVLSEIAATDYYQVRTVAEQLYLGFATDPTDRQLVWRMAPVVLVLAVSVAHLLWWIAARGRLSDRRTDPAGPYEGPVHSRVTTVGATILLWTLTAIVVLFPLGNLIYQAGLEVVPTSFGRESTWALSTVLSRLRTIGADLLDELALSLLLGQLVAAAAVSLAAPVSWWARQGRIRAVVLAAVVAAALSVPSPLLAIGAIRLFNAPELPILHPLYDRTFVPLWLVMTCKAWPWAVLICWPAARSSAPRWRDQLELDGCLGWRGFWSFAVPYFGPYYLAAWLLAAALSLGELSGSILLNLPGYTTLPMAIFSQLHYGTRYEVAASCAVLWLGTASVGVVLLGCLQFARNHRRF